MAYLTDSIQPTPPGRPHVTSRGAIYLRVFGLVVAVTWSAIPLGSQAVPTASTPGALLLGAGYVRANADYSPATFQGGSVYLDGDFWESFGLQAKYNHVFGPAPDSITETSYEVGVRGRVKFGPIVPFLELSGGLGSFDYRRSSQNGSYGLYSGGGGVDVYLTRKILFRGEYEYQRWSSFPPRGLQPNLLTLGVAYRLR